MYGKATLKDFVMQLSSIMNLGSSRPLSRTWIQSLFLAVMGTVGLYLEAKITIPLYPVKISMQPFMAILLGVLYGPRLGALTVGLYLLEGALGLPVFQGTPDRGLGLPYMMGPTGGYLMGFMMAAMTVGMVSRFIVPSRMVNAVFLFAIGAWVNDVCGLAWLTYLMGFGVAKATFLSYQLAFLLKAGLFGALMPLLMFKHRS